MVSLSRLFHKTEELDTKTAAVPTSAAPACAQTAEAKTASVELPQEFLDKFPGGMFRYKAESAGVIDRASSGLVRLFGLLGRRAVPRAYRQHVQRHRASRRLGMGERVHQRANGAR